MTMTDEMRTAARVVNEDLPLIMLAGIGSVFIFGGIWTYLSIAGAVVAFLARVVVLGRIANKLRGEGETQAEAMIRVHWVHYLVVTLIIAVPVWSVSFFSSFAGLGFLGLVLSDATRALIGTVTVFVLPIVFLKCVGSIAIPAGLVYFFRMWSAATWVIGLVLLAYGIGLLRYFAFFIDSPFAIPIAIVIEVLVMYLLTLSFTGAVQKIVVCSDGDSKYD